MISRDISENCVLLVCSPAIALAIAEAHAEAPQPH